MTGKIIHNLKRKREENLRNKKSSDNSSETDTIQTNESKREKLNDRQEVESVESIEVPNTRNKILLEALQKIVELQNELDEFENDLDDATGNDDSDGDYFDSEDAEISYYLNDEENKKRHDAEALGFAMCARETLLFLQREGISQDSLIYQTLRGKLVGKSDGIPI